MKSAAEEQAGRESEGAHSPTMTIIHSADRYGRSTFPSVDEAFAALCRSSSAGSQVERGKGISLEDASSTPSTEDINDETALSLLGIDHKLIKYESISDGRTNAPEAGMFDPTRLQDFSVDRTRAHVKKGQFWAIYDNVTDEMPRYYCLVHEVKRAPIFSMDVVLLEPTSEVDDWLMNRSFAPATGEFRLSEWKITCRDRTMLSQLMDVRIREGGGYEVCPQVGEVWALYADYGEVVDFDAKRQAYDLGLVEGHVDDERACRLRKLEKVEGCANLWAGHGEPRWYLYEDYLGRFSHRVPAVPVPCNLHGVPRFCMVLDPYSLPDNNPASDTEQRRISN